MIKTNSSKVVAAVVGLSLSLAIFAGVGANVASAQAMTLSQLVDLFISLGIISSDKAAAAKAAVSSSATVSVEFTRDLTVGSTGADVTALQTRLGSTVSGYFGPITKAAVQTYQAANGIPSTGYVGPLTRAELNKTSTTGGTTTGGTTTVVNTGIEGTLNVTKSSVSNVTAYEGDSMRPVLSFKAEAKVSDIAIQRVKIDLGTSTSVYTKVYKTMYLVDDSGAVLAQADLNSNTVVKDGDRYQLTLGGFSYLVAKNSTKVLTVKADIYSSIKVADQGARTVMLANSGVRGVDGAGIDQYSPTTGSDVSQTINLQTSLVDSASATLSINSANFKSTEVIASVGSQDNEYNGLSLLAFDVKAQKDNVLVTDIKIQITKAESGAATTSVAYLIDGSREITESVNSDGSVTFRDVDISIAKDATKTFVVKADIRQADASTATFKASVDTLTIENSVGDTVNVNGSATGAVMYVRNIGPMFTLTSKTINKSQSAEVGNTSTTTVKGTFDIKIKALGEAISFDGQTASSTFAFKIYQDGTVRPSQVVSSSTSFVTPSTGVIAYGANGFTLQEENEITLPVEFVFVGNGLGLGSYAIGLESVAWASNGANSTNFMAGNVDWRTSTVQLP